MDDAAIRELFAALGPLRLRRMFGGLGIYAGDLFFALEAGGELFLKADAQSQAAFEAAGSRPFSYEKNGKAYAMSYWLLPEAAFDDPDAAAHWGLLALEAARRAALDRNAGVRRRQAGVRPRGRGR